MKKLFIYSLLALLVVCTSALAESLKPRIVFEKHLWAEGVNPKARNLEALMVKFFDEDMVRLRDGELLSTNNRNNLDYAKDFLKRHPEIAVELIISMPEQEYAAMIKRNEERSGKDLVDLFSFYRFRLPVPADNPKALLADILQAPEIETAYYEPIPYSGTCTDFGNPTPDFIPQQDYHDPAPLGVDLGYAWDEYGEDITDGSSGIWTGVIELGFEAPHRAGFMFTHENFSSAVNRTPETNPDTLGYHGTAVGGIVGGCDDNGVGVVGFTADNTINFYDILALSSVADAYTRANSQLIAGDYTNSSWGYFSNPMPPGQTCPCNPGQNGMVPAEYDPSVKTAIENGTAGGIFYFICAGNGCTDLDDATFGNTFRWAEDTDAAIVGAIDSAAGHDASCFTSFGERVTLNSWGDDIVTMGYGTLYAGIGQREYYANSFGGTSGATPIVAGCGGVVNNVYRDLNGTNLAPATLRSYLDDYGTLPGTTPGNIGRQPNLRGILAPDLTPYWPSGWDGYAVPRNLNDATGAYAPLPTNLNSTPSTTYWNAAIVNNGRIGTATSASFRIYRDDIWIVDSNPTIAPYTWMHFANVDFGASTQVRGGRHAVRVVADIYDDIIEGDETNNANTRQFVWDPIVLTDNTAVIYSRPPVKIAEGQTGSYYNCDGFKRTTTTGYWEILAVQSGTSSADYDARIYSEAVTSTNGFDSYEEWSAGSGNGYIDFVGINNNVQSGELLASVINYDNESADYSVEVQGSTILSPSTPGYGRNSYGAQSITGSEIFEVWEFYVDELVPYTVEVDVSSGNADMVISIFGPDNDYFDRGLAFAASNSNDGPGDEMLTFTPTTTGWYSIVVHKDDNNDWLESAWFTLYLGKSLPDLTHTLRSGWSHKIVVRQSSGGDPAVLPATLDGNISINYANAGYINQGGAPNTAGVVRDSFFVDGIGRTRTNTWASWSPGTEVSWYNINLTFIYGGRHSVGDIVDALEADPEWNESNNRHDVQFVWSPYPISNQNTYGIAAAPNFRDSQSSVYFTNFNVDAFQFTGTLWTGVAMTPQDLDDEYNCYLYEEATTSTSGLDTRLANSWATGSNTEWVLENGNINGSGSTYNMGVNNNWSWPGTPSQGSFRVWQCNSIWDLYTDTVYGPYTMSNNCLIHVYDLYLDVADTTQILLDNQSTVDLGFAIYGPTVRYASRTTGGTVVNSNGDGLNEVYEYIPDTSGWHGLVVFKQDVSDQLSADYRLIIGERIPKAPTELTLIWTNHAAGNHECLITWEPVVADIFSNPLIVDAYDLYYTLTPNEEFGPGWLYAGSLPGTITQTMLYIPDTWEYIKFAMVARDEDGLAAMAIGSSEDNTKETLSKLNGLPKPSEPHTRLLRPTQR